MSKQLTLSAALSVLAMAGYAFLVVPASASDAASPASPFTAKAPASIVPSLGTLLPAIR